MWSWGPRQCEGGGGARGRGAKPDASLTLGNPGRLGCGRTPGAWSPGRGPGGAGTLRRAG